MKRIRFSALALCSILAGGLLFSACNKSDVNDNNPNDDAAGLMAVNLAPDRSVLMAFSGNVFTGSPLGFTNYTGGYIGIYPGNRTLEAYDYASQDSLATTTFNFEAKKYYSAFVMGSNGTYRNVVVEDQYDSLAGTTGKARIRFVNAIPASGNATVTVTAGGSPATQQLAYGGVSSFEEVGAGDVTIQANDGAVFSANRTINMEERKLYTVLIAPGASTSDPAQIKFIVNGTLDDNPSGRQMSSTRSSAVN